MLAMMAGVASSPATIRAGSPGSTWVMTNTSTDIPSTVITIRPRRCATYPIMALLLRQVVGEEHFVERRVELVPLQACPAEHDVILLHDVDRRGIVLQLLLEILVDLGPLGRVERGPSVRHQFVGVRVLVLEEVERALPRGRRVVE